MIMIEGYVLTRTVPVLNQRAGVPRLLHQRTGPRRSEGLTASTAATSGGGSEPRTGTGVPGLGSAGPGAEPGRMLYRGRRRPRDWGPAPP